MKKIFQIDGIVSIILGLLLIFIPSNVIINFLQFILGLCLIFIYLPIFLITINVTKSNYVKIKSLIFTILGFVIMIFGFNVIGSIVGTILIVFLLIDLINSQNRLETLKKDLIKYILALVLIGIGINKIIDIVILISGGLLIIVGIIKMIAENRDNKNNNNNNNNQNYQPINENFVDVEYEEHEE